MNDSDREFIGHADVLEGDNTNKHHSALSIPSANIHDSNTLDEREENIDFIAKSESSSSSATANQTTVASNNTNTSAELSPSTNALKKQTRDKKKITKATKGKAKC